MDIVRALKFLLQKPEPFACLVKGPWGVGKTYFINHFIKTNGSSFALKSYSYCSLFGLDSLATIEETILLNTNSLTPETENLFSRNAKNKLTSWSGKIVQFLPKVSYAGFDVNAVKEFVLSNIAGVLNADKLIIVDDLERRSPKIALQDILGLLSKLKSEKSCQILVIANDDKFDADSQRAYQTFKEKLFDRELSFDGSSLSATDIVFLNNQKYAESEKVIHKLGISNIRVAHRIKLNIDEIKDAISSAGLQISNLVEMQIQNTAVLATWADLNSGPVTIDNLLGLKETSSVIALIPSADLVDADRAAYKWLHEFGYANTDRLDEIIIKFVASGILDTDALGKAIADIDEIHRQNDAKNEISKGWNLLHNSLAENATEIVTQFKKSLLNAIEYIGFNDLNGPIEVLRGFGADEDANKIIEAFFTRKNHIINDDNPAIFWRAKDEVLAKRLDQYLESRDQSKSLEESIFLLQGGRKYGRADIARVASATEQEIYDFLKRPDVSPMSILHTFLKQPVAFMESADDVEKIRRTTLAVIQRLRSEGRTNALRLQWVLEGEGIEVPPDLPK